MDLTETKTKTKKIKKKKNQSYMNEKESNTIEIDGVIYCKMGQCGNCKGCIYDSEQKDEIIKGLSMLD